MPTAIQRSFAGGEIAPALYGRADQAKYQTGLRACRNFIVKREGGVENRPGTRYIAETKLRTPVRLQKFIYNENETYLLELGPEYLRLYKDNEPVVRHRANMSISAITNADPGNLTYVGTALTNGQGVRITGVRGMPELNDNLYFVDNYAGFAFDLVDRDGNNVDTTNFGTYLSGGQIHLEEYIVTAVTQANPGKLTYVTTSTAFIDDGAEVRVKEIVGMTELNGKAFISANKLAGTFELTDRDLLDVDTTGFTAYSSDGRMTEVLDLATPYLASELADLSFAQLEGRLTICHPNHAPRSVEKVGVNLDFSFVSMVFRPDIAQPNTLSVAAGAAGTEVFKYRITAIGEFTGEESLPGLVTADQTAITGVAVAAGGVITVTAGAIPASLADGDEVWISSISTGMDELENRVVQVTNVTGTTFDILGLDGTGFTAWTVGGTFTPITFKLAAAAVPTLANPHVVTWTVPAGTPKASGYLIYRENAGYYGFLGTAVDLTFSDVGVTPNPALSHPIDNQPFRTEGNYPAVVAYFQQRQWFGRTNNQQATVWASKIKFYLNFNANSPTVADSPLEFTIAGTAVNEIRHIIEVQSLVVLTSGGEWTVEGDGGGGITAVDINLRKQGYRGASNLDVVPIGNTLVFMQARGEIPRDLRFRFENDGYIGQDLGIFSSHFFSESQQIINWDFQQVPNSVVWAAMTDGTMAALTYILEHQVWGWSRHDTNGEVLDVEVVPDAGEDATYFVVHRNDYLDGGLTDRYYIERLASREIVDVATDAKFLDSYLAYDGRQLTLDGFNQASKCTLTGGTLWDETETLTATMSHDTWSAADVGNGIVYTGDDGEVTVRLVITAYTSPTVVSVRPDRVVPTGDQGATHLKWCRAADVIAGLEHLEGATVGVFADGFALPQNAVAGGQITLDDLHCYVVVGMPYICDMQTLDLDTLDGETLIDKPMRVNKATILVEDTRGIFAGPDFDHLTEYKQREAEGYDDPITPVTAAIELRLSGTWEKHGRIAIRQAEPLPITVLAIAPSGIIGGA